MSNRQPGYHPIWSNFSQLFVLNLKFIPFFLPSLLCMTLFFGVGGLVFPLAALVLLLPAGPAVAVMYECGYRMAAGSGDVPGFFRLYRLHFRQGLATMAVLVPFLATLGLVLLAGSALPFWIILCLVLAAVMLMAFAVLAFSQVVLTDAPLTRIWRESPVLILMTSWRGVAVAVAQLLFAALVCRFFPVALPLYVLTGPAVLIAWSCRVLWPRLEPLLPEQGL